MAAHVQLGGVPRARTVAAGLMALGVESGDFVAIMAGNRPEHVTADLAALLAGAVPVSMYNTLAQSQIQYIAAHCGAKVAVVENLEFMQRWEACKGELPGLDYVVLIEGAEKYENADWVVAWDDVVTRGTQALADDPSLIDRTSAAVAPTTWPR